MNERALIGKCGLYCGACAVYRVARDGDGEAEKFAARFNCPVEKVKCNGCGDLLEDSWGLDCKIVSCLRDKGLKYCYECPEYDARSCEKYEHISQGYAEDGVDTRANLSSICEGREDEWLAEQRKFFTCSHCGNPVIVGRDTCHHCSRPVR